MCALRRERGNINDARENLQIRRMCVEKVTISGSNNIIEGKTENSEDVANAGSNTDEFKTIKYVSNRLSVTNDNQKRNTNESTKRNRRTLSYADVVRDGSSDYDERSTIRE